MAYSTSNPPALVMQSIAGPRIWKYDSADAATALRVAGYFSNGWKLGMRLNDVVIATQTGNSAVTIHTVNSASATGGVDVTDGLAVGTTDTD